MLFILIAGIIIQTLFTIPLHWLVIGCIPALALSLWKKPGLYLVIFLLSGIITSQQDYDLGEYRGRKALFSGTVIAETQYTRYKKLLLDLHDARIGSSSHELRMPVEFYAYAGDVFSGKEISALGRLVSSRHAHRPMLLSGTMAGVEEPGSWLGSIINRVRNYIEQTLAERFSPEYSTLCSGLVLGGSGRLHPAHKEVFTRTGVLHVFAVSGLHVGFVCAFVGVLLLWLPISHKIKFALAVLVLCLYAALTGFRPSVCRATLMAFLFGLSLVLQRNVEPVHITTISAIVFLIANPLVLFDVSAQLSFAAVYGIVLVYPVIRDRIITRVKSSIAKKLLIPLGISFSAQVCVWPLLLYYFHRLPTLAVLANLFIVPVASVTIFLLFSLLIMNVVFALGAQVLALIVSGLLHVLVFISTVCARVPFAAVTLFISPVFLVLVYGLYARRTRPYAAGIMLCALAVWSVSSLWNGVEIRAASDAMLITLPHAERIFIAQKKNVAIQHTLLHDHNSGEAEYVIASDMAFVPMEKYYRYPDELSTLQVHAGDIRIACDETVNVYYHDKVVFSGLHGYVDDERDVRYILSDGEKQVSIRTPLRGTILDHIVRDVHVTFIKIRLLFG